MSLGCHETSLMTACWTDPFSMPLRKEWVCGGNFFAVFKFSPNLQISSLQSPRNPVTQRPSNNSQFSRPLVALLLFVPFVPLRLAFLLAQCGERSRTTFCGHSFSSLVLSVYHLPSSIYLLYIGLLALSDFYGI